MAMTRAGRLYVGSAFGVGDQRATGRQTWLLLWRSSRVLATLAIGWLVLSAVVQPLVMVALGLVVGGVPAAVVHGMNSPPGHHLIVLLIVAGLLYALSLVLDPVGSALGTAARARITGQLQGRLIQAVSQPAGIAHLEDASVLDRLARAEGKLTGFFPGDAPVTWVGILATRISGILGCLAVALYIWWLGLLLLVIWLAVRRVMLRAVIRQATEFRAQTTTLRRAWYFTGLGSKARDAKEMRVFGLASFAADRFRTHQLEAMRGGAVGLRDLHRRAAACFVAVLGGYAVALVIITNDARTHAIGLGSMVILLLMLILTSSAGSVSFDDITLAWTLAGLPDIDSLESELGNRPAELSGTGAVDGLPRRSVRFEGVHFRYPGTDRDVLTGLDLELRAGTSTAIVGVNGAGKSTLVSLLSRLRDPSGGRLTVDGTDIKDLSSGRWQRTVALMPQQPAHYPVSAYDNIAFGALEFRTDREGVEQAARTSGFLDVIPTLPEGWDTILSRELPGGADLSGGQWQRLALARALFATRHGARLLVLDEPTASLDVRGEAAFYQRFLEITEGLTTVLVSHRFATVRRAHSICVLDGGRVTEQGTHDELLALGGAYAKMYRIQAARFGGTE